MKKFILGILVTVALIATMAYGADVLQSVKFDSLSNTLLMSLKGDGSKSVPAYSRSGEGALTHGSNVWWDGSPAPSSPVSLRYRWAQVGKLVFLTIRLEYNTAGSGNQIVYVERTNTDIPAPIEFVGATGTGANVVAGGGGMTTAVANLPTPGNVSIYMATPNRFYIYSNSSLAAKFASGTWTYFTN